MKKIPRSAFLGDFKKEAVKTLIDGGLGQSEVCRRLSLGPSTPTCRVRPARNRTPPAQLFHTPFLSDIAAGLLRPADTATFRTHP